MFTPHHRTAAGERCTCVHLPSGLLSDGAPSASVALTHAAALNATRNVTLRWWYDHGANGGAGGGGGDGGGDGPLVTAGGGEARGVISPIPSVL